jgi:hypothetical protein
MMDRVMHVSMRVVAGVMMRMVRIMVSVVAAMVAAAVSAAEVASQGRPRVIAKDGRQCHGQEQELAHCEEPSDGKRTGKRMLHARRNRGRACSEFELPTACY